MRIQELFEKLSRLLDLIQRGNYTPEELGHKFSVSKRTIQNWVSFLRTMNIHIYFDRKSNCYKCPVEGKLILEFRKKEDTKKTNNED